MPDADCSRHAPVTRPYRSNAIQKKTDEHLKSQEERDREFQEAMNYSPGAARLQVWNRGSMIHGSSLPNNLNAYEYVHCHNYQPVFRSAFPRRSNSPFSQARAGPYDRSPNSSRRTSVTYTDAQPMSAFSAGSVVFDANKIPSTGVPGFQASETLSERFTNGYYSQANQYECFPPQNPTTISSTAVPAFDLNGATHQLQSLSIQRSNSFSGRTDFQSGIDFFDNGAQQVPTEHPTNTSELFAILDAAVCQDINSTSQDWNISSAVSSPYQSNSWTAAVPAQSSIPYIMVTEHNDSNKHPVLGEYTTQSSREIDEFCRTYLSESDISSAEFTGSTVTSSTHFSGGELHQL